MPIAIPGKLETLLGDDKCMIAAVHAAFARSERLLDQHSPFFFPEYTDHSLNHVEQVLRSTVLLITGEAFRRVSPADAAMLSLSTLVHDLGMHLTAAGFRSVIKAANPPSEDVVVVRDLDERPWGELWADYLAEARRWDGKALNRLFGSDDPVEVPPDDEDLLTVRDRKLIGEFIRRHHGRVAHEIALAGIPGSNGRIPILDSPPGWRSKDFFDLVGLIARSHTAPLRSFFPYLQKKRYHIREYRGVHIVFVMAVLRIADYLQLQADRAPSERLQIQTLRSPISQREWFAHDAIRNITLHDEDPEAIVVDAQPGTVETLFRLKHILSGLQSELDTSWAVLGEVYARHSELKDLTLSLRRVKSNIDDMALFARESETQYLPLRATFQVADAELLQLFVTPLYGDDPTIGLRELIQNSVDAVRELHDYRLRFHSAESPTREQESDVYVNVQEQDGTATLTISDTGIGMTPMTVISYFLTAGASFRKSRDWKEMHAPDGQPTVVRSGRFGIGVLSAFILGDEIRVTTRHVTEHKGVEFVATINAELIELRKCEAPVGTSISIHLSTKAYSALKASLPIRKFGCGPQVLYLLRWPSLSIRVGIQWFDSKQTVPSCTAELSPAWNEFDVDACQVFWSSFSEHPAHMTCNGFAVKNTYIYNPGLWERIVAPQIAVMDPQGRVPLSLARNHILRALPFEYDLALEVARDAVALLLLQEVPILGTVAFRYGHSTPAGLIGIPGGISIATREDIQGAYANDLFEKTLFDLLGSDPIMPYDLDERALKFGHAHQQLARQIAKHQARMAARTDSQQGR